MSEFEWSERTPGVTRNPCPCGTCDVERRVRTRMAEAEQAARWANARLGRVGLNQAEYDALVRLVRHHEALAEALGDVLGGGF